MKGGDSNRQLKQYGTAIPLPHLEVSVKLSKVCSAVAQKGMQSCTTQLLGLNWRGKRGFERGRGGREGAGGRQGAGGRHNIT